MAGGAALGVGAEGAGGGEGRVDVVAAEGFVVAAVVAAFVADDGKEFIPLLSEEAT